MITKHIVEKTQHTKEPRGQPISSRCSQNTLSRKHNTQKSQEVSPFPVGDHKTHCQENTTHKRAKRSAHFQQVITKHIVEKTQHTKEPRGQPISSRCSQNTLSRKHNTQKSQEVSPLSAGEHKTHCQENTTHKRAKRSAHFQQVITKHIVKKTQHTKEPRGQLFPAGDHETHCQENTRHKRAKRSAHFRNIVKKTQDAIEPRGQPISSRCSQNTLSRKFKTQKSQEVSLFPEHCQENTRHNRAKRSAHLQ